MLDWYYHIWIITILIVLIASYFKNIKIELIPYYYLMGFSAFTSFYINRSIDPIFMVQYRNASMIGFIQIAFLLYFAMGGLNFIKKYMPHLFWFNIGLTYLCNFLDLKWHGLGINLSLNGTLLSLQLAFVLRRSKFFAPIAALIAIALTRSSMGLIAIIIGMFFFFLFQPLITKKERIIILTCPIFLIPIFLYLYGASLFSLTGREKIWAIALEYMNQNNSWIFGHGWGSWAYLGPKMQIDIGWLKHGLFIHLHSDILQVLFESGIVGLSLFGISFGILLTRFYKRKLMSELYFIIAFIISCIGNFPLRLAPSMILLGLIIYEGRK